MMIRTGFVATTLVGALFVCGTANAAVDGAALCKDKKAKATGKKAFDFLKAFGKNLKTPNSGKLDSDISKAKSKFTKSFSKAESKRACQTTDDTAAIESKVDDLVFELVASIDPNCGDNVRAGTDEECDGSDKDACTGQCVPAGGGGGGGVCGDNIVTVNGRNECTCAPEDCDGTDDAACAGMCQPNCRCPVPICGNGLVERGEGCEPPGGEGPPCGVGEICGVDCQCAPALACACGDPDPPTTLVMTTIKDEGRCGKAENAAGEEVKEFGCSKAYVGNNDPGIPTGTPPAVGTQIYNVEACYGTKLVLGNTTQAETGSAETCSSAGCRAGAPIPVFHSVIPIVSVCTDEIIIRDAFGSLDCSTGEAAIRYTITSANHLHAFGDVLRKRCSEGSDPGLSCRDDSECPGGGTCELDLVVQPCPICNPDTLKCNGGPNNGLPCTPDTPEYGPEWPTSDDCPPVPAAKVVDVVSPFAFTTAEEVSVEASNGHFCGFCYDSDTLCFEGNPDTDPNPGHAGCPDSSVIPDCQPATYHDGLGGSIDGCGTPIPCTSNADCYDPYESCQQALAGAYGEATATKLTLWGSAAGDLRDRSAHAYTRVSHHCIPPTWKSHVDAGSKFPSPGSVAMQGTFRLAPSPSGAFVDPMSDLLN